MALTKNKPPNSGAYASARNKAAKIRPTPTAHPPKGKERRPNARHFSALRNITSDKSLTPKSIVRVLCMTLLGC